MHDLVFHPSTKIQIDMFVSRPSHAVILAGPEGIGKFAASQLLASKLLLIDDAEMLDKYPYKSIIKPEGQSISIEKIRELIRFAKLKIPSASGGNKRLVIIDGGQLLTTEAQNSLLKLLEEPPADMCLILSAS